MDVDDRTAAEARWLQLTRHGLPALALSRGWPVHADHCFQRIFFDNACNGVWYDHVLGRPAYAAADRCLLDAAILLAEEALAGDLDLYILNQRSLKWRRERGTRS